MKVRIGNQRFAGADVRRIEAAVEKTILDVVRVEAIEISKGRMQKLARELQTVATLEALKLFSLVSNVIDSGERGFSFAGGQVRWEKLNYLYQLRKQRRAAGRFGKSASKADISRAAARAGGFFILSGRLKAYFKRQGSSIVLNRFGGVKVDVNTTGLSRSLALKIDSDVKFELGRINVSIFPKIDPSLMPMMASRQWADVTPRATFERAMLPEGVANKLSGGRGPYRPLVLPLTQYFMLVRIPGALRSQISKATRTTIRSAGEAG